MNALQSLTAPPSRDAQLAASRIACARWIAAVPAGERGLLWEVLKAACDRAESLGLGDESFQTFVKNAKRYHRYLHDLGISESQAFEQATVDDYQLYVARLRRTGNVPPTQRGKPLTAKTQPVRRAAEGSEPRLAIGTQKDLLDAVRILWKAARRQRATGFSVIPESAPTSGLEWRDEEERDPVRIEFDLEAMLSIPFVPAKGRSRCEYERNLVLAHFYAALPTRSAELRESVWEGLQVWHVRPGAKLPQQRWRIEALLSGEVQLDQDHVLFLTFGGVVPTKSDTFRSVPIVGALAERVTAYALTWVQAQLDTLKYLRYGARKQLFGVLRSASFDQRELELLIDGARLTVRGLEGDFELFKSAHRLRGAGLLKWANVVRKLTSAEAQAFRDLIWAESAATRYTAALAAFSRKTPIRDVFAGVFLPSRVGGVLCDSQVQLIWRQMGWTEKGWTAQHLRAHAAQLFETQHLKALRPLGRIIGHKEPMTTRLNYTGETPYADVVVAELIADQLARGRLDPGAGLRHREM